MFVTICFGKKWKRRKPSDFHFGQDYSAKIIKGNRILFDLYNIIESEWGAIQSTWCQYFSCTDLIYFLPSLYQVRPITLVGVIIFSHKVLTEMVLMISALANSSSHPGVGMEGPKQQSYHIKLRSTGSYCHCWCMEYSANKSRLQFLELQPFSMNRYVAWPTINTSGSRLC